MHPTPPDELQLQAHGRASSDESLPLEAVRRAAPTRRSTPKRPPLLLLAAAIGILAAVASAPSIWSRPAAPIPEAKPTIVAGIGRIIPEGDIITVAPPYGATGARVESVEVVEGETVEAGAILATLDNARLRDAALDSAEALVALREAQLEQMRVATTTARAEAAASLGRAQTILADAERELRRIETLVDRGAAADAALDRRQALRDEARLDVERAQATFARYGRDTESAPDVAVAKQTLNQARADLLKAREEREQALLRAPIKGTILSIDTRPGEAVTARDMMTLGNLARMVVEAEIYESERQSVQIGARATITARALPASLSGRVTAIGLAVKRQSMIGESPAAATDARVFKVGIKLDEASSAVARDFTNLQVTARIDAMVSP
jgi:HlyD family secretion protein